MPEPAADVIVRNLIEALERLRGDLDRGPKGGCFFAPRKA
jgi:hypothetical protein